MKIDSIIIHCSDSPDDMDVRFEQINKWHKERGFKTDRPGLHCGYHWIVCRDGVIEMGRDENMVGAHTEGWNERALGICWAGRSKLDVEQRESLLILTLHKIVTYGLDILDVYGHFECNPGLKTCPNFHLPGTYESMNQFRKELKRRYDKMEVKMRQSFASVK